MDAPAERPILTVLVTRTTGASRRFSVIALLAWPYYESMGWEWIGLDPEHEAAWYAWRAQHPEAA